MGDRNIENPPGYEFVEYIGGGAMGDVYEAIQLNLDRRVAIKTSLFRTTGQSSIDPARLLQEAKTIARLDHHNIVRVHDCFIWEERIYMVMELLQGRTLAQLLSVTDKQEVKALTDILADAGKIRLPWILWVGVHVSHALDYAHKQGIYHRDIKPSNIFITDSGVVKLLDFSIARDIRKQGLTSTGVIMGSPPYMSPEQIECKDIDGRTDIYSLGCVLFHCVTGTVPFHDSSEILLCVKHLREQPPDPSQLSPECPQDVKNMILKCLEKDKTRRYKTGGELAAELNKSMEKQHHQLTLPEAFGTRGRYEERIITSTGVQKAKIGRARFTPLKAILLVVSGLLLAVIIGGGIMFYMSGGDLDAMRGIITGIYPSSSLQSSTDVIPLSLPEDSLLSESTEEENRKHDFPSPPQYAVASLTEYPEKLKLFNTAWCELYEWETETIARDVDWSTSITVNEHEIQKSAAGIGLSIINNSDTAIEVSYLIVDGSIEYYYVDANWYLNHIVTPLAGICGGKAFPQSSRLRIEPGKSLLIPIVESLPPDVYFYDSLIKDIRICGEILDDEGEPELTSSTVTTQTKQQMRPRYTLLNRLTSTLAVSHDGDMRKILERRIQANVEIDNRLNCMTREEIINNLLDFYGTLKNAGEKGILATHLVGYKGIQIDNQGNCELLFKLITNERLTISCLVLDGVQAIEARDLQSIPPQAVRLERPLRGMLIVNNISLQSSQRDVYRVPFLSRSSILHNDVDSLASIEHKDINIRKMMFFATLLEEKATGKQQPLAYTIKTNIQGLRIK